MAPAPRPRSFRHPAWPHHGWCARCAFKLETQRPAQLAIRRLDSAAPAPYTLADARKHVLADLPGYIRFLGRVPNVWMGGLKPNTIAPVSERPGGWGFLTGLRYQLQPGQALAVTRTRGAASYTGFQLTISG